MSDTWAAEKPVTRRPIELADLATLLWDPDSPGEHQWFGTVMRLMKPVANLLTLRVGNLDGPQRAARHLDRLSTRLTPL